MIENDFKYLVEYEENRLQCTGDCGPYCRCTTVNPVVTEIRYDQIYKDIVRESKEKDEIKLYLIDRAIRKLVSIDNLECCGIRSYYGEEASITLTTYNGLKEVIDYVLKSSPADGIEKLLLVEYGYVLPELLSKKWKVEDVYITSIRLPYASVSKSIVASYTGDEKILCQTLGNGMYRLIDGNHRHAAAVNAKRDQITIITTVI